MSSYLFLPLHSALHAKSWIFVSWFNSSFWKVDGKNPSFGRRAIAIGLQNAAMQRSNENILSMCFWQAKLPLLLFIGQLLMSSIDILCSDVLPVMCVSVPQLSSWGSIWTSMTSWPWPSRDSSARLTLVWNGAISLLLLRCECLEREFIPEFRLLCDLLLLSDFTDSVSIIDNWYHLQIDSSVEIFFSIF